MPVSLDQFSDIAARQNVRDSGVVTVDSRQDLRLNQSRFRLVRWVRDAGIGKRFSNRRTVDEFISSLQHHYGPEVTSRMDFRPWRAWQSRGKPLHVRDIKAAISEADMVADGVKSVRSSNIEGLVDEQLAGVAYLHLPGGEALAREVRDQVDIAATQAGFAKAQSLRAARGELSGEFSLYNANDRVEVAINYAHKDIFLTGYGVRTSRGLNFDKVQQIFDQHPRAQALKDLYGLRFDASRASGALHRGLTEELSVNLTRTIRNVEGLPGEGSVRDRVMQAIDLRAERIVDEFIQERTEALERLQELHARGEINSEDMGSFGAGGHRSLADVVLHQRIPPSMLSGLYALRAETPDNLGDLASGNHTLEHKFQILGQFGEAMAGIETGLSESEFKKYVLGSEKKQSYIEDCGRFLLEGKLSADDVSAIRHAVRTDPPGSSTSELFCGIAAMRRESHDPNANLAHWAQARDPLDKLALAGNGLLGFDVPSLEGEYTTDSGNVLTALRNYGIGTPPPDNYKEIQSGKGAFSRAAVELAQKEMEQDLDDKKKAKSEKYPEFHAEAIKDFNRADFTVDGKRIERGDVEEVVSNIRAFCTDADGNPDDRMLDIVGQMVYQRSNSMGYHRFSTGNSVNDADTVAMFTTAPLVGMPVVNYTSSYTVAKSDTGNVLLRLSSAGPATHLIHPLGPHFLDEDQSSVTFNINVEIDAQDYSARVSGMGYEFRLVPAHKAPQGG